MYLKCKNKLFFIFGDFRTKNYWQESKKNEKNGFLFFYGILIFCVIL